MRKGWVQKDKYYIEHKTGATVAKYKKGKKYIYLGFVGRQLFGPYDNSLEAMQKIEDYLELQNTWEKLNGT